MLTVRWLILAVYISIGPILVFAHSLGAGSAFSGLFITGSTAALLLCGRLSDFRIDLCDLLYAVLLCCIGVSFFLNGFAERKEMALLCLSLAAYPAGRLFPGDGRIASSFLVFTGLVVAAGALFTAIPLIDQWSAPHGKPLVFGEFDAAPAQFTASFGFLAIALLSTKLPFSRAIIAAALSVPAAIFAASMVRFSFVALAATLLVVAFISTGMDRRRAVAFLFVIFAGAAVGIAARADTTIKFARYVIVGLGPMTEPLLSPLVTRAQAAQTVPSTSVVTICPDFDHDNSVSIRKQLYADAVRLMPAAGVFGIGIDRFMASSCVKGTEVHNTVVQAAIEFGWVAAAVLVCLGLTAAMSILPLAGRDLEAKFVLCSLLFIGTLSMAYGRISQDALLFLFFGYAVNLRRQGSR
jgi:hypothetical protein